MKKKREQMAKNKVPSYIELEEELLNALNQLDKMNGILYPSENRLRVIRIYRAPHDKGERNILISYTYKDKYYLNASLVYRYKSGRIDCVKIASWAKGKNQKRVCSASVSGSFDRIATRKLLASMNRRAAVALTL